jgi:hypothetical protein
MTALAYAIDEEQLACAETFSELLTKVCETTAWEYGEIWIPNSETVTLQLSSVWYVYDRLGGNCELSWKQFRSCSEAFILGYGEGLPGRVWASEASEWIADVSTESESYFLRHQIAKAFGVRAAFGLPVKINGFQAIVAFFQAQACDQDLDLMALTEKIVKEYSLVRSR